MKEFSIRAKQAFTGRQGGTTVYSRLELEEEDGLGASLLTSPGGTVGRGPDPGARSGAGAGALSSGGGGHVYVGSGDHAGDGEWQDHAGGGGDRGDVDLRSMVPTPEEELLLTSQLAKEAAELLWEFLALGNPGIHDVDIHAHLSALLDNARVLQAQMRGHIRNYTGGHEAGLAQALEASDMLTTCLQEYEGSQGSAAQAPPSSGYQAPQPLAEPLPAPAPAASPFPVLAVPPPPAVPSAIPPQTNLLGLEELFAPSPPPAAGGGIAAPTPTLAPGDSLL